MRSKLLLAFYLLLPATAMANVGIPVVSVGLPFLVANLAFVVLIEAVVLGRSRGGLNGWRTLKHVLIANLITTFIAYPAVAVIEAASPLIGLNLGWFLPFENLHARSFYIGTVMLLTLIPCYFLSVWIEGRWLRRNLSPEINWKTVHLAHVASYAWLVVQIYSQLPVHLLNYGWVAHRLFRVF